MGDVAVGARSGHEEPERPEDQAAKRTDDPAAERSGDRAAERPGALSEPPSPTTEERTEEDASRQDREASGGGRKQRSFWKELPILIGVALVLALVIKTFLVQAFSIPSDSMQDTLQRGDRVLVDKLTPWFGSTPERGEVVVFHDPGGWLDRATTTQETTPLMEGVQKGLSFVGIMPSAEEKDLIKRVVAVGGDTVECRGGGPVKVNGKQLKELYLHPGDTPCSDQAFGPVRIPEGRIWVMGDHRQNSLDSRYHQRLPGNGTVSEDDVVGRAVVVAWPVDRWNTLPVPETFDQPGLGAAAAGAAPAALGLLGAVPVVLWRRRRLTDS